MQIIQWLFKGSNTHSRTAVDEKEEVNSKDLVVYEKRSEDAEAENTFRILLERDDSAACFHSTLQLMRLDILRYNIKEMGHKAEAARVGYKVLPICDVATLGCGEVVEKEVHKRRRTVSRMKELLRWAAAAKSSSKGGIKGWKVLYFRNKMAHKECLEDASTSSSKVSFRWDVGSCSTSSSVFSPMSMPLPSRSNQMWSQNLQSANSNTSSPKKSERNRAAQWITTDSDFVVLEL